MFRFRTSSKGLYNRLSRNYLIAHCEEEDDDFNDITPSIVEQADAELAKKNASIKTPMQYDNLKLSLMQGQVNTFDGFRFALQKQINLNAVASHFYWVGSQATGQPIYQYRLILPFEDDTGVLNAATDMDFNVECEVKYLVAKNMLAKTNFSISEMQGNVLNLDLEVNDESSATHFQFSPTSDHQLMIGYMQSITPSLTLGGVGKYSMKLKKFSSGFGGIYEWDEHTVMAQWDNDFKLLYMRKVNPDRVHLFSDLTVAADGNKTMSAGAEFTMKQSKIHMSIDSSLMIKSSLEMTVQKQLQLQLAAEMQQMQNHYRFGVGVVLMG